MTQFNRNSIRSPIIKDIMKSVLSISNKWVYHGIVTMVFYTSYETLKSRKMNNAYCDRATETDRLLDKTCKF